MTKIKNACIFSNGILFDAGFARRMAGQSDLVIAANGGLENLFKIGMKPDIVIGDTDSISLNRWGNEKEIEFITFRVQKDKTDTEFAIELAIERNANVVSLVAARGGRMDHLIGNVLLLLKYPGIVQMVDGHSTLVAMDASKCCYIDGMAGQIVSLLPLPGAKGITTIGLKYECDGKDLEPGTTGISNRMQADHAEICIRDGLLLVYVKYAKVSIRQLN